MSFLKTSTILWKTHPNPGMSLFEQLLESASLLGKRAHIYRRSKMESLVRIPTSEMMATLEVLAKLGITPEHLKLLRSDPGLAKNAGQALISALKSCYVNEELKTSLAYPAGYRVKPIVKQIRMIAQLFHLDPVAAYKYAGTIPAPPEGTDLFAVPKWQAVATTGYQDYPEAVKRALALLQTERGFLGGIEISKGFLQESDRSKRRIQELSRRQEGEILVFPAQFGKRHAGKSVRRARETFSEEEFGLGIFHVVCMLLTHPERMQGHQQLDIDCAGDEHAPGSSDSFYGVPRFVWCENKVYFTFCCDHDVDAQHSSASGFVLK